MATKPVVVGVDGSEESLLAAEWAAMEAKRYDRPLRMVSAPARHADLAVVHAWSWFPAALRASAGDGAVEASLGPEQISAEATDNLAAALERWRDKYPGVRVGHEIIRGHPGRVLANYSARADLVVIGRHGSSGVASIRHALLDHARGPVAVVPSGD